MTTEDAKFLCDYIDKRLSWYFANTTDKEKNNALIRSFESRCLYNITGQQMLPQAVFRQFLHDFISSNITSSDVSSLQAAIEANVAAIQRNADAIQLNADTIENEVDTMRAENDDLRADLQREFDARVATVETTANTADQNAQEALRQLAVLDGIDIDAVQQQLDAVPQVAKDTTEGILNGITLNGVGLNNRIMPASEYVGTLTETEYNALCEQLAGGQRLGCAYAAAYIAFLYGLDNDGKNVFRYDTRFALLLSGNTFPDLPYGHKEGVLYLRYINDTTYECRFYAKAVVSPYLCFITIKEDSATKTSWKQVATTDMLLDSDALALNVLWNNTNMSVIEYDNPDIFYADIQVRIEAGDTNHLFKLFGTYYIVRDGELVCIGLSGDPYTIDLSSEQENIQAAMETNQLDILPLPFDDSGIDLREILDRLTLRQVAQIAIAALINSRAVNVAMGNAITPLSDAPLAAATDSTPDVPTDAAPIVE